MGCDCEGECEGFGWTGVDPDPFDEAVDRAAAAVETAMAESEDPDTIRELVDILDRLDEVDDGA